MHFADPFKRERPSDPSVYRDAAFLSQCRDGDARDWLKNRPVEFSPVFGTPRTPPESHVLEYILYRRNLPLIDLALAEHGRSGTVLKRVYKRVSHFTRVVSCTNASLFYGDEVPGITLTSRPPLLRNIVTGGSFAELRAVCENSRLDRSFYASLVNCWKDDNDAQNTHSAAVSSDRFKHILYFLSNNPRVSTKLDPFRLDARGGLDHLEFNTRCWKLATVVPVEPAWAFVLSELYRKLTRYTDDFGDVKQVLDRWRPADEEADAFSWNNPFPDVREQIAAKFLEPSIDMLNDDDLAIRRAFYRTFDPERPEFRELDWTEWLERDERCDIWLSGNEEIWRSSLGRSKLRSLLWHKSRKNNDVTDIDFFDEREEEYRKANPEWFDSEQDEEEYEKGESEPDQMETLDHAVRGLTSAYGKRRSADAIWFLVAAFIGSIFGGIIS